MAGAFLVGTYLHFIHGSLWWMVTFVMVVIPLMMVIISSMMDVISFMIDGCIMYGEWFHLLYCTYIMDLKRMMYSIFAYVYYFKPFIPCEMYSG